MHGQAIRQSDAWQSPKFSTLSPDGSKKLLCSASSIQAMADTSLVRFSLAVLPEAFGILSLNGSKGL
jgi:hypothetical protein